MKKIVSFGFKHGAPMVHADELIKAEHRAEKAEADLRECKRDFVKYSQHPPTCQSLCWLDKGGKSLPCKCGPCNCGYEKAAERWKEK